MIFTDSGPDHLTTRSVRLKLHFQIRGEDILGAHSMFKTTLLPNGLRILTSAMPSTRSASIGLFVEAGSRYDSDP